MLTAFARAFRTPDLRKKILFSMGIMALFRLGSVHPDAGRVLPGGAATASTSNARHRRSTA